MKKYILLILVLLTVIFAVTACDSEQAYCKNCDNKVAVNEAVLTDSLPHCDKCGHNKVYYK